MLTRNGHTRSLVMVLALVVALIPVGTPLFGGQGNGRGDGTCDGGGSGGNAGAGPNAGAGGLAAYLADLPLEELSEVEIDHLLHMREEEKLARDVYLVLFDIWEAPIFEAIARSEQRHTDAVAFLLERYDLPDSAQEEIGAFTSDELAALFTQLVDAGSDSLVAALTVGATIEDLDISDLAHRALPETDNEDVRTVYQNLLKGSRNHMRSFASQLAALGVEYEPQYVSAEELAAILETPRETGLYDANGEPVASPAGDPAGDGRGGRRIARGGCEDPNRCEVVRRQQASGGKGQGGSLSAGGAMGGSPEGRQGR